MFVAEEKMMTKKEKNMIIQLQEKTEATFPTGKSGASFERLLNLKQNQFFFKNSIF